MKECKEKELARRQEILGHADISITMNLYAHVMEETKRRQMDAVAVMP